MELPQSRSFGNEGRKPTHDFLSLYSPAQQDPRPSSQGAYLKTHDFLQPLEREVKNIPKEGKKVEVTSAEKPSPPATLPSVEHILPGGIGTYSISHISYMNQGQKIPKPEGVLFTVAQSSSSDRNDENSNCSSYAGSGFTLWEESAVKKGKTGKENIAGDRLAIRGKLDNEHMLKRDQGREKKNRDTTREAGMKIGDGQWTTSMERPSQSSSNHNHHSTTFSSLSSSQPSSAQKNQSFVRMIASAKNAQEDEEDDDEEFVIKKEPSSHHKGVLSVKVDAISSDQKPNTPRSKHSATEQRRRSKINDRFSMLRNLIPHSDQKRDKASFLLEVIEYIQFLQEKVHKYEEPYQGWNSDQPPKLIPWSNSHRPTGGSNCASAPALLFAAKFNENNSNISPTIPRNGQNLVESDMSSADTIKDMGYHAQLANKASPFPAAVQPNFFSPSGSGSKLASDTCNMEPQLQSQLWQSRSSTTTDCTVASDKLKDQELMIESGTISISTVYSQGLLSTLTQALQSSGVDLSQASISVQIDLGKRANSSTLNSSATILKKNEIPSSNQALPRSRLASASDESDKAFKRFKTSRN